MKKNFLFLTTNLYFIVVALFVTTSVYSMEILKSNSSRSLKRISIKIGVSQRKSIKSEDFVDYNLFNNAPYAAVFDGFGGKECAQFALNQEIIKNASEILINNIDTSDVAIRQLFSNFCEKFSRDLKTNKQPKKRTTINSSPKHLKARKLLFKPIKMSNSNNQKCDKEIEQHASTISSNTEDKKLDVNENNSYQAHQPGSTVVAASFTEDDEKAYLHVLNLGDSAAFLVLNDGLIRLTNEHNIINTSEENRITCPDLIKELNNIKNRSNKTCLSPNSPPKSTDDDDIKMTLANYYLNLPMTRALIANPRSDGVSCYPEISKHTIANNWHTLILGTDGFWDHVFQKPEMGEKIIPRNSNATNEAFTAADLTNLILTWKGDIQDLADTLNKKAQQEKNVDDITVVIIRIKHNLDS